MMYVDMRRVVVYVDVRRVGIDMRCVVVYVDMSIMIYIVCSRCVGIDMRRVMIYVDMRRQYRYEACCGIRRYEACYDRYEAII